MYLTTSNALAGFQEVVSSLGGEPAALLKAFGFKAKDIESPNNLLPTGKVIELFHSASIQTDCEYFGLLLAAQQPEISMGVLGPTMRVAESLRKALQFLEQQLSIQATGLSCALSSVGNAAFFRVEFKDDIPGDTRQTAFLAIMFLRRIFRYISDNKWQARRYYFSFRAPADQLPARRLLHAPIDFDAEFNGIEFDADLLDLPLPYRDPYLHQTLKQQVIQVTSSKRVSLAEEVQDLMHKLLLAGDCSIDIIADFFPFHRRTLQRRLKASNTSYQQLLDAVRLSVAKHHLADSEISVTQLSELLGYSRQSVFSHAFKKATGLSPNHWRSQHSR